MVFSGGYKTGKLTRKRFSSNYCNVLLDLKTFTNFLDIDFKFKQPRISSVYNFLPNNMI